MTTKEKIDKNLREAQPEISQNSYYKYLNNMPLRIISVLTIFPFLYYYMFIRQSYIDLVTEKIGVESVYLNEIQKFMPRAKSFSINGDQDHFSRKERMEFKRRDVPFTADSRTMSSITIELDNDEKFLMSQIRYRWHTGSGNDRRTHYRYAQLLKHDHNETLMDFNFEIHRESVGGKIGKAFRSKERKAAEVDLENRTLEKAIQFIHKEPVKIRNLFSPARQEKWEEKLPVLLMSATRADGFFSGASSYSWKLVNKVGSSGTIRTIYTTEALSGSMFEVDDIGSSIEQTIINVSNEIIRDVRNMTQSFMLFRLLTEKM